MSKYSGRCDAFDSLVMLHKYTDEELKNNVNIYIGNIRTPLKIESQKDLIPYYAHIVSSAGFDNAERKATVFLTSKSWVDMEEQENLQWRLNSLLRMYNRCKRKKIEFNVDEAVKEITWNGWNEEPHRELAKRVKEYGKKATIDGIHLKMHERYRQELVDTMIENGLDPIFYGDYKRFIKKKEVKNESIKE
jgi:hypothetical protein